MIVLIEDDYVAAADQRADGAQVGLHSGREDDGSLLPDIGGQLAFQLLVHLEGAVQKARACAACTVMRQRLLRGLPDLGMGGQAQVVVGPAHDQPVAANHRLGPLILDKWDEVGAVSYK